MLIIEKTSIHAPIGRCFALSTRVELVQRILGMKPVDGVISGHITAGSRVVWRGWKFGWLTRHHTLITKFQPPHSDEPGEIVARFQDSQEKGRFAFFRHDHFLREWRTATGPVTQLEDEIRFTLPFGFLGRVAEKRLMTRHIRKLTQKRFAMIKELAEGDGWRDWVDEAAAQTPD